ncbi:hypothetical protein CPB84DRAFT_1778734 [Gymnopilus junonius]|nr:hypothetical protein CPB84DRAFT_1778734 [Gymnopilus junonius]
MCEVMLRDVRNGLDVLGVFYGHPGVFVSPSHRAIALAREEGFNAKMLAGVSAEDCLFADLEFDPASFGCMTCEASELLIRNRPLNPYIHNVIWQVGSVGVTDMTFNNNKFPILIDRLEKDFGPNHTVIHYVGRVIPQSVSKIETFTIADLRKEEVMNHFDAISTLYVPPRDISPVDPTMAEKLGPSGTRVEPIEAFRPSLKWSAQNDKRSYAYNPYESDVVAQLDNYVTPEGHRILQGSPAMKKFLITLATSPQLLQAYRENPSAIVDTVEGLNEQEKYGLKLGSEGAVYALMSRPTGDIAREKELTNDEIANNHGAPYAFVSAVIIAAIICAL